MPIATSTAARPVRGALAAGRDGTSAGDVAAMLGLTFSATFPLRFACPLAAHLRDAFHEHARLFPRFLGLQALQQLDRVRKIIVDGLLGRFEVDPPDLF